MELIHKKYRASNEKLIILDAFFCKKSKCLKNVVISGDFFLEPDSFINDLKHIIENIKICSMNLQEINHFLLHNLPLDTKMLGISILSIASLIYQVSLDCCEEKDKNKNYYNNFLEHDYHNFSSYKWDIIKYDNSIEYEANFHLALDEVLMHEIAHKHRKPLIRFWNWSDFVINLGSFQSFKNSISKDILKKYKLKVVRRISGGGSILMHKNKVIIYSLYCPQSLVKNMNFIDSYIFLDSWIMKALKKFGILVRHKKINDIITKYGKIGGSAQKRILNRAMVHHGALSYNLNNNDIKKILFAKKNFRYEKPYSTIDSISRYTKLTRNEIINLISKVFIDTVNPTISKIKKSEINLAKQLVDKKFSQNNWIHRIP